MLSNYHYSILQSLNIDTVKPFDSCFHRVIKNDKGGKEKDLKPKKKKEQKDQYARNLGGISYVIPVIKVDLPLLGREFQKHHQKVPVPICNWCVGSLIGVISLHDWCILWCKGPMLS